MTPTEDTINQLIPVPTVKGCVLYLTGEEYRNAIRRGKRIRRRRQYLTRVAKMQSPPKPKPAPPMPLFQQGGLNP